MSYNSPPAWSIGGSKRSTDWKAGSYQVPGPGSYEAPLSNRHTSPRWRLGTATRDSRVNVTSPGPGAYQSPGRISKSPPSYSIGSKLSSRDDRFTPGPGAYSPKALRSNEHRSPSYTMRPKTSVPTGKERQPGPGAYDVGSRILNETIPNVKMGTSTRDNFYRLGDTPGPGTYSARPQTATSPKWGFGTTSRDGTHDMSKTLPGPGSYNQKSMFENGSNYGTTMTPRRPDSAYVSASRLPGPGAYNPSLYDKKSAPSYRIGSASRDGLSGKKTSPGPGNYQPRYAKDGPSIGFGTSSRTPFNATTTPGPGTYETPSKISEGPKYVISPRREDQGYTARKYTPGPGAYSPRIDYTRKTSPQMRMGTESRDGLPKSKSSVGPGSYNLRKGFGGPKWGFGSESRGNMLRKDGPGPGYYDIRSTIGAVPSYVYNSMPLKIHL